MTRDTITYRILGCGSSGGVPRLGGHWGECDPDNPKNRRQRCSLLVTRTRGDAVTRVLIDTSPDMRAQLLDADVGTLDAVIYTHAHADHVHGLDDLRMICFNTRERLQVWADGETADALLARFGYAFVQPRGSSYPPICELNTLDDTVTITGAAGPLTFTAITVEHGTINALGLRCDNVAYMPDVSAIPPAAWDQLQGLDLWIIDALRRTPHPTHSHLSNTLDWIIKAQPKRAILTNMHLDLDYDTVRAETPEHVTPAFDGLEISYPAP